MVPHPNFVCLRSELYYCSSFSVVPSGTLSSHPPNLCYAVFPSRRHRWLTVASLTSHLDGPCHANMSPGHFNFFPGTYQIPRAFPPKRYIPPNSWHRDPIMINGNIKYCSWRRFTRYMHTIGGWDWWCLLDVCFVLSAFTVKNRDFVTGVAPTKR